MKKKKAPRLGLFLIIFIVVTLLIFAICYLIYKNSKNDNEQIDVDEDIVVVDPEPEPEPVPVVSEITFQPIVDEWVNSVGGNRSVIVYDLDLDKMVGYYNADEKYNTASLYKLFVVYEGYRRLESGVWSEDEPAGYTGRTILECLDLAIRESNSPCAETLWGIIGHEELDQIIINDFGITDSNISYLTSNPQDILKIMQIFYNHKDITNSVYIDRMKDSFFNQPITTYDWRQGFPSGFSHASVYNKVGWDYNPDGHYWNIYHDAAIVKFPMEDGTTRDFIVIVMTNKIDFTDIRRFGTELESGFYQQAK